MSQIKEPPIAMHAPEPVKYSAVIKVVTEEPRTPVQPPPSFCRLVCRACSLCTLGLLLSFTATTVWALLTADQFPANNGNDLILPDAQAAGFAGAGAEGQRQQELFDPLNDWTLAFTFQGAAIDAEPVNWCNDSGRAQRDASASGDAFITYRRAGFTSFRIQTFFLNPLLLADATNGLPNDTLPFVPFSFMVGDSGDNWQSVPVNYQQLEKLPVGERGMFSPQEPVSGADLLKVVLHDIPQDSWRAQVGDVLIVSM